MKFNDLRFTNLGCCDSDSPWAEVIHANGLKTEIHKHGDAYQVITWSGRTVQIGLQFAATEVEVMALISKATDVKP
jgi:hypothetical protein